MRSQLEEEERLISNVLMSRNGRVTVSAESLQRLTSGSFCAWLKELCVSEIVQLNSVWKALLAVRRRLFSIC